MVALNQDNQSTLHKLQSSRSTRVRQLGERIERYFRVHAEASRAAFLLDAVRHELLLRERLDRRGREAVHTVSQQGQLDDNLDRSAALAMRLANLNYRRHGVWPRLRRFFCGCHAEE